MTEECQARDRRVTEERQARDRRVLEGGIIWMR